MQNHVMTDTHNHADITGFEHIADSKMAAQGRHLSFYFMLRNWFLTLRHIDAVVL